MSVSVQNEAQVARASAEAALELRIATLGDALQREPARPDLAVSLAEALRARGSFDQAKGLLDLALALSPDLAAAHLAKGNLARATGDGEGALEAYERAAAAAPGAIEPLGNKALALKDLGRLDEAIATLEAALARAPGNVDLLYNLGNCRHMTSDLTGAAAQFEAVLAHAPQHRNALINLGLVHRDLGRTEAAIAAFDKVIALSPDHALAHWNRALSLLLAGDYERGFPAYEWRWRATGMHPRAFDAPPWDGKPLDGRTILLHAEQGLGDTIQFVRYAPLVAARGGRVLLEVQAPLTRLLGFLPGVAQVIRRGEPLPAIDYHAPLMSLPALFGTTLETVPAITPYLSAPACLNAALDEALETPHGLKKIGLVWGGNPARERDAKRSCPAAALQPLTGLARTRFFSLQKGEPHRAQIANLPGVTDLAPLLGDMADTAHAIGRLDLVITIDTAVAHLAGALGKPVWVMLGSSADWRYLLHRSDSPWYASMTLFRQQQPGDWAGVVASMRERLASGLP